MRRLGCWLALGVSLGVARGQQTAAPPAPADDAAQTTTQTTTLTARTTLVVVPTLVRDKKGANVYTLTANDFRVTDDGVEQKVRLEEETGGEPLAMVVLVELGGAGIEQVDKLRGLSPMVDAMAGNVPHKIAVVGFDSKPEVIQDFSTDTDKTAKTFEDLGSGDHGAAILDGLAYSVEMLKKQPQGTRRAILLISETVDHGSSVKLGEALKEISDTNTAIYSLAFNSTKAAVKEEAGKLSSDKPGPVHGCMSRDKDEDLGDAVEQGRVSQAYDCLAQLAPPLRAIKMLALVAMGNLRKNTPETVAHLTGGEYVKVSSEKNLEKSLEGFSNHIANRYVLSFTPQSPHAGLHVIGVSLPDHVDLKITARENYWADAEER